MLVAIAGSQGCGKTTILNELQDKEFKVVTRKTSRSILTDWNISLQEVNSNPELTLKFQEEILVRKFRDESHHYNHIWITERTYMDLAVFNNFALAGNNNYNDFVNDYYERCIRYTQTYDLVFYIKAGHFRVENDGVRGANIHYSRMVDLVLEDAIRSAVMPSRLVVIDTPLLSQRINTIESMIRSHFDRMYV